MKTSTYSLKYTRSYVALIGQHRCLDIHNRSFDNDQRIHIMMVGKIYLSLNMINTMNIVNITLSNVSNNNDYKIDAMSYNVI